MPGRFKGLSPHLASRVFGYSSVTHWLREAQLDQFSETAVDFTEDAEVDEIDEAILSAFEVQPFGSVRDMTRLTRLARSAVHWHLTRSLGFLVRHLRWILHALTEGQKRIRVSNSERFLAILQEQQGSSWRDFVTLDESWFYLHIDHERI
jgi:MoxR-like ATPase